MHLRRKRAEVVVFVVDLPMPDLDTCFTTVAELLQLFADFEPRSATRSFASVTVATTSHLQLFDLQ